MNYPIYTKNMPNPRKKTPILLQILTTCKLKWPSLQDPFCIKNLISGGEIWTSHTCHKSICIGKYIYHLMCTICAYKQVWICKWMFIVVPNAEKLVATSCCFSIYRKSIRDSKLTVIMVRSTFLSVNEIIINILWHFPCFSQKELELFKIQRAELSNSRSWLLHFRPENFQTWRTRFLNKSWSKPKERNSNFFSQGS